jgi:hypothetical protein
MVRADARRITQEFIQVRAARMCNTLLPVEAEYFEYHWCTRVTNEMWAMESEFC